MGETALRTKKKIAWAAGPDHPLSQPQFMARPVEGDALGVKFTRAGFQLARFAQRADKLPLGLVG